MHNITIMSTLPFQLHVSSDLKAPLREVNTLTFGPTQVIKLERTWSTFVQTGIYVVSCKSGGKVMLVPHEKFEKKLKFRNFECIVGKASPIRLEIVNISNEYIRIEPTDHVFTFKFIEDTTAKPVAKKTPKKSEVKLSVEKKITEPIAEVKPAVELITEVKPLVESSDEVKVVDESAVVKVEVESKKEVKPKRKITRKIKL